MNHSTSTLLAFAITAAAATAQGSDFLYTTSQSELTLSGSGGTVLRFIRPNDVVGLQSAPCPARAEKWAPRNAYEVMAGDENGDDSYQRTNLFGAIDALVSVRTNSVGTTTARHIYFSPAAPMGTVVSGGAGLRPGDVGRIVRNGFGDGQVEYFLRAEQIQIALGLPATPVVIDVDAVTFGPNVGIFLSLDSDIACSPCGGPTVMRDGDVFCIPPWAYSWTTAGTIAGIAPGSAIRVYTEAMMNTMTANAMVADRFGACVTSADDIEALDIDWSIPSTYTVAGCGGVVAVPTLIYTAETLTGGSILSTAFGGTIHNGLCGPLGTGCGFGPTLGLQIGLRPPTAAMGIPSYINSLSGNTRLFEFAAEAATPQIPAFNTATIDFVTPAVPLTWVFMSFAPGGPGAVRTSAPFIWGMFGFPDYYPMPNFMGTIPTGTGFGSYTSPAIPFPVDLVFQGATILGSSIEVSTPTMVEVF
ncbi:MAG: hypothetical protein KDC98_08635 [Planctomycetes bacterium]|nr:hypothetical protein [Planctomycetota bacterium]